MEDATFQSYRVSLFRETPTGNNVTARDLLNKGVCVCVDYINSKRTHKRAYTCSLDVFRVQVCVFVCAITIRWHKCMSSSGGGGMSSTGVHTCDAIGSIIRGYFPPTPFDCCRLCVFLSVVHNASNVFLRFAVLVVVVARSLARFATSEDRHHRSRRRCVLMRAVHIRCMQFSPPILFGILRAVIVIVCVAYCTNRMRIRLGLADVRRHICVCLNDRTDVE